MKAAEETDSHDLFIRAVKTGPGSILQWNGSVHHVLKLERSDLCQSLQNLRFLFSSDDWKPWTREMNLFPHPPGVEGMAAFLLLLFQSSPGSLDRCWDRWKQKWSSELGIGGSCHFEFPTGRS